MDDYKSAGLLVLTRANPRVRGYDYLSGHLSEELYVRGDRSLPTLFIEKLPNELLKSLSCIDSTLVSFFKDKGFNRADPVLDMLLGNSTHVFCLEHDEQRYLRYRILEESDGGW
jgi:hypothetical protein